MTHRRKLLIALGAGAFAVMSLLGYMVWLGYQQAIRTAQTTTRNYAAIMEARLDATLRRVEADLQDLALTIPVAALNKQAEPRYSRELNFELRAHLVNFPELTGIRITDATGERLYTSDSADTPRTQLGDRDYFRQLRDNPGAGLVFSEVIISRAHGRPSMVVGRALRDGQGAFRGTVFAVIELNHFQKLFQSLDIGVKGIVAVYRSGVFSQVVRWPLIDEKLNTQLPPDSLTRKVLAHGNKTATTEIGSRRDGVTRIYSFHALDRYPFFVAVGVARDEVLAAWRARSLMVGLTGLLLLGLLVSLLSRLWRAEVRQMQSVSALVQSEGRFRALFDRASEGIMILSTSGKLIAANEAFARMHGYTPQEMQTLSLKDLDIPETFQLVQERIQRILSGESLTFEVKHYHKEGHIVSLEASASLIVLDGENLIQTFHRDIDERKRAEQAAQRQNELMQLLESLTHVTNEAATAEPALRACLERICEHGNWTLGHVAAFAQGQSTGLAETSLWYRRDLDGRYKEFIDYSDSYSYNVSAGRFTGVALREQKSVWIEDLSCVGTFGRNAVAVKHGLRAGLALPIVVNGRVTDFLEFFSDTARPADSELIAVTESVASMMARLIERARALNALHEREHLMRLVTEGVPAMIAYYDADLRCLYGNTAFFEFRRRAPQDVIGKTLRELTGEEIYRLIKPSIDLLKKGKPVTQHREERNAAGEIRQLESHRVPDMSPEGTFRGYYAMLLDITERMRTEEINTRLAAIVESTNDAIISRAPDRTILTWNAGAERLFGWTAEEAIGRHMSMLIPPEREEEVARNQAARQAGHTLAAYDTARLTKDGRLIDVSLAQASIKNSRGEETSIAIIFRDISARKRAEAARNALEAQLRDSQKMEAIGTLAGGIAHDFNNIIAAILGNVELARQDVNANPLASESLEEIRKAGARARDLVQQILSFSRRQPLERKRAALALIVEESVRLLRATLPPRVALEVWCDAGVPAVLADATQIEQVVINLATNAMQAMHGGAGHIGIRLDTVMLDAALADTHPALHAMHTRCPGRTVRLAVSDDGSGMDKATLGRIFEPFFTTKAVGEGTGLGLSVVRGIVQTHEGEIVVDSRLGKGTSFTVYLPVAGGQAGAPEPEISAAAPVPALSLDGGQHILYIDDDESLVFLVQRLLERRGYRISCYIDSREALAALRADPASFDLVVTDFNMPGMSGLDVAREVRAIRANLPVAVASGFIDEELRAQAGGAGVWELIFKANTVEDFCEVVNRLLQAVAVKSKSS